MFCTTCGAAVNEAGGPFCPACGGGVSARIAAADNRSNLVLADKGIRVAGYLLDVIPAMVLGLVGIIPIVGVIIAGFLLAPYWLLRDIAGASLGKLVLGTKVVRKDGQPASAGARVLRNLPLAIGPALLIIPLLGYVVGPSVAVIIVLTEAILLLSQGDRIGDRLAGTTVVRK